MDPLIERLKTHRWWLASVDSFDLNPSSITAVTLVTQVPSLCVTKDFHFDLCYSWV